MTCCHVATAEENIMKSIVIARIENRSGVWRQPSIRDGSKLVATWQQRAMEIDPEAERLSVATWQRGAAFN